MPMVFDWLVVQWCRLMNAYLPPGLDWLLLRPFLTFASGRQRLVTSVTDNTGHTRSVVSYLDPINNPDDAELLGIMDSIKEEARRSD